MPAFQCFNETAKESRIVKLHRMRDSATGAVVRTVGILKQINSRCLLRPRGHPDRLAAGHLGQWQSGTLTAVAPRQPALPHQPLRVRSRERVRAARCCGDTGNEDRAGDGRSETRAEIGHAAHRTGVERQVAAKTPPVRVVVVSVLTLASPANSPDRKLGHRTGASSDSSARLLVAGTWDIGTDTRLRPSG